MKRVKITGALVVATSSLNKGVVTVDVDAATKLTEVANASTPTTGVTSQTGTTGGHGGARVAATVVARAGASTTDGAGGRSCKIGRAHV